MFLEYQIYCDNGIIQRDDVFLSAGDELKFCAVMIKVVMLMHRHDNAYNIEPP